MYCINCGVKLADTEKKCPLCNTSVCHPNFMTDSEKKLYPSKKMPKKGSGAKALSGAVIIIFLIPAILSFFSDIQANGALDWFGYVFGALVLIYTTFALPFWFRRPNPVIFTPCSFFAAGVYLLYINLKTGGDWFMTFAFPIVGALAVIVCTLVTLTRYLKKGRLYIYGGISIAIGAFILLLEHLMAVTFGLNFIGWSVYSFIPLALFGGLLLYFAISKAAREVIKQKFFF